MARKAAERVFKINFGDNSIIYIVGNDDIVAVSDNGISCIGEDFEDKKIYCTKTLLVEILGISERSLERYVHKKIIFPEAERIDRKQVFDFFQSCYNLVNYKQMSAFSKGDSFLPPTKEEDELINKQYDEISEALDKVYNDLFNK